jgi:hypothetical protein
MAAGAGRYSSSRVRRAANAMEVGQEAAISKSRGKTG